MSRHFMTSHPVVPCICESAGEFGVVYKGQHTEPEGDIGYKASIVAVKTLKGGGVIVNKSS